MGAPAIVNSAWEGRIGIPDVRNDRSCHYLSRVARTKGSDQHGGVNWFFRPNECKCRCKGLMSNRPSRMRPEAQLSAPLNWDTSLYDKNVLRIFGTHVPLYREPWILGGKLSPDPGVTKAPETGYP